MSTLALLTCTVIGVLNQCPPANSHLSVHSINDTDMRLQTRCDTDLYQSRFVIVMQFHSMPPPTH
jgi:hypothetical protein